jgi:hypothetical protein
MFSIENIVCIALQILLMLILYFLLSSRESKSKQLLEGRIAQLEERVEYLEAMLSTPARTMTSPPPIVIRTRAPAPPEPVSDMSLEEDEEVLETMPVAEVAAAEEVLEAPSPRRPEPPSEEEKRGAPLPGAKEADALSDDEEEESDEVRAAKTMVALLGEEEEIRDD